jgi:hypothetical protein
MTFSAIQILIVIFAVFAVSRVYIKVKARDIPKTWAIVWGVVWTGAAIVALLPGTSDLLASRVGIGRGADLLVYVSVMALFYIVFRLVVKIESMQQDMTKLVRAISMKDLDK